MVFVLALRRRKLDGRNLSAIVHSARTHAMVLQGKNPAVNRIASVIVPGVLGAAAIVMLVNGAHKLYTGQGKME